MADYDKRYPPKTPDTFKTILPAGTDFEFISAHTIFPYLKRSFSVDDTNEYTQIVYKNGEKVFENVYTIYANDIPALDSYRGKNIGYTEKLKSGDTYKVEYEYYYLHSSKDNFTNTATYYFSVAENKYPLKKRTVTDVLNRLCDVCEPIHKGERPRFRLQGMSADGQIIGGQAELFEKIIAPQFSFTKQTLRECLQEVGKVVHGEPRLTPKRDGYGWYYEISYELYGGTQSGGLNLRYTKKEVKQSINSYCSHIDSNAENIVNQLDRFSGVITEPYDSGFKTVRTESTYVRIEEGNMLIATQYPIYSVEKLEVGIVPGNTSIETPIDITPFLFEKSLYDTQLSSFNDVYPYSKKYGLYFTQGEKNIQGLNFKVPNPKDSSLENYSIVNILRSASGKKGLEINSKNLDYIKLAFRVTYTPFYDSRITQSKVYYKDISRSSGLVYNQQSNIIETHYYGENLKGVVARMGNIEKTVTFLMSNINRIPKAGQLYDKDYYISTVASEILPTCIKCTIGLSKDFNRLSEFIGISSVKRYSEVSQTQAQERNVVYRNYIVVGKEEGHADAELIGGDFLLSVVRTFRPSSRLNKRISNVVAWGEQKSGNKINAVQLPVISSAFGNSISFSWQYEDNYSAGAIAQYANENNVSGYFQNNLAYCDYFGRIYYYHFALQYDGDITTDLTEQTTVGMALPKYSGNVGSVTGIIRTPPDKPFNLQKDSREIMQFNVQIDFVSNDNELIIGSALASYNPLIRGYDSELGETPAKLYVFDQPLSKFVDNINGAIVGVDLDNVPSVEVAMVVVINHGILSAGAFPADGKSWAIITNQKIESIDVEDENGNPSKQPITYGGNVLLAKNMDVVKGAAFESIYFTPKREVFDRTVWKDIV